MFRKAITHGAVVAVAFTGVSGFAAGFTDSATSNYWGLSYTDSGGTYYSPAAGKTSVGGGVLSANLITDGTQALANMNFPTGGNNVDNYVRTFKALAGTNYDGTLLGSLSGQTNLSATFNIANSAVSAGSQFTIDQLVGEGQISNATAPVDPSVRFSFSGANGSAWFSTAGVSVTSLIEGQDTTLSVDLNPALWSDMNGVNGASETATFQASLGNVTKLGFAFGSGNFFSDGFAFNTGGNATFNVRSIQTTGGGAAPEPASLGVAGIGALALLVRRRR